MVESYSWKSFQQLSVKYFVELFRIFLFWEQNFCTCLELSWSWQLWCQMPMNKEPVMAFVHVFVTASRVERLQRKPYCWSRTHSCWEITKLVDTSQRVWSKATIDDERFACTDRVLGRVAFLNCFQKSLGFGRTNLFLS